MEKQRAVQRRGTYARAACRAPDVDTPSYEPPTLRSPFSVSVQIRPPWVIPHRP